MSLQMNNVDMLIGGKRTPSSDGQRFDSISPIDGIRVASLPEATIDDVDRAVGVARGALDGEWKALGPAGRQKVIAALAELLRSHSNELAHLDTLEMGMPISRSAASVESSAAFLDWYAAMARNIHGHTIENSRSGERISYTIREPVGVVGAITPWNAPLTMMIWKLGPVLASGSTLVHKPAEFSSLSALRVGELCIEAGVPEGVVNIVTGGGTAGEAIASHLDVDKVAFTGSISTGQKIIRASAGNVKRLTMELGGKSPNIIFADADLETAADAAAAAIFGNSGQVCTAASRILVERSIQEEFLERLEARSSALAVGDPRLRTTDMGPVAASSQLNSILEHIERARSQGAKLVTGGNRISGDGRETGYFIEPTIFSEVRDEMSLAQEEVFGPVVAVTPFDSLDEAIGLANSTKYGLAAYVWSENIRTVNESIARLKTGSVHVNSVGNLDPAVPVGGRRMSGYGKELGYEQIEEYLETKAVWIAR